MALVCATAVQADRISSDQLDQLPPADIYLLGELHDHPTHHVNQARVVSAASPKAIVFEMLSPAQADAGQDADRSDAEGLDAALGWSAGAWPDFEMYYPIFAAAPAARIYGAALPPDTVRAAVADGAVAMFEGDADLFGLSVPLDLDEQSARETAQDDAHCNALPASMLGGMVEAQRLRDAAFSRMAIAAHDETGGPVVVITGNGHARRDWGMPRYLAAARPDLAVLSLGQVTDGNPEDQFDLWIESDPVPDRGDPCAAFQTN